ncbi:hypothetical protein H4S06_002443 [Coemansia sp. BCRC 34490]|nr:hypothetical protein LPJ72_003086 [Coemansia sp. Benny D160-2]KAJ2758990.1 hypothetical protein H4S06_002443 [Coemansia sp. BCRC 34490]
MVLKPISRAVVPSPVDSQAKFDDFVTQYLNKCDDLISYTRRYPVVRESEAMTVQRQNRNPHEDHRWLRRNVAIATDGKQAVSYDDLKSVLFVNRADHLPRWTPMMAGLERIEAIVPNLCDVFRYSFRSQGLRARRDYCQLVIKREFLGEAARPKPRLFTPSASMANLVAASMRSQSSMNLAAIHGHQYAPGSPVGYPMRSDSSPASPTLSISNGINSGAGVFHKGLKSARSVVDLHDQTQAYAAASLPPPPFLPPQNQFAGLDSHGYSDARSLHPSSGAAAGDDGDDDDDDDARRRAAAGGKPVRRFQIVSIPMLHRSCTAQRGHVRAFYESYEEVREYADGRVEWICIHHSDFSGWVPSFMSDRSIANAFPREAEALLHYVEKLKAGTAT